LEVAAEELRLTAATSVIQMGHVVDNGA
jgi:hypothetical protein